MPPEWSIEATPLAEEDLTYLRRRQRNVRQHVRNRVPALLTNPHAGEELQGELAGIRSYHFWNARYRLAYMLDESDREHPRIIVLAVGLKDGFYRTLEERIKAIGGHSDGETEATTSDQ